MGHLFISYSRQNKQSIQKLRNDLQAAGLTLWIDSVGLQPGTPDWDQALRDAINESSAVLLCASPSSRRSPYVRDEIALAKAAGKPIYPLWIAGENWLDCIPLGLGSTQHLDLRGDTYHANLPRLIGTLNGADTAGESAGPVEPIVKDAEASKPVSNPRNPYKGLQAFQAEDRNDFFGREVLVEELVTFVDEKMQLARILAVLGASGSGKSSVLLAGLLPTLQEEHPDWLFLDPIVPTAHPLEKLTITLARQFERRAQTTIRDDLLDRSTRGLHRVACELSDKPVVLYIDQFEELFTLVDTEADRRHFIDLLTTAVTEPGGVLILLLSMRADFYDRPLQYSAFGKLIQSQHVGITPMTLADLYDVVQKPAQLPDVGLQFEENLITEMVFAVLEEAAALPLLQFTLDQLFEQRDGNTLTWQAYEEIGGIQGALAQHAEATYSNLPSTQHQQLARALFLRLIEPGQTEQDTTRRRASYSELTLPDAEQTRILQETADVFVDARLLVSDQSDDTRTLEVSHETLIRKWERLSAWLQDAREDLRLQKSLAANVAEWQRRGNPDDLLYRGTVLAEAQAWRKHNIASRNEAHFLNRSEYVEVSQQQQNALGVTAILVAIVVIGGIFLFLDSERGVVEKNLATQQAAAQAAAVIATSDRATTIARLSATPTPTLTSTATPTATPTPTPTVRPPRASVNEIALQYNPLGQQVGRVEEETSVTAPEGVNYLIISGRTEGGANSVAEPAALFLMPGSEVLLDRVDNSRDEIEMELMNNSNIFMEGGRYVVGGVTVTLAENRNVSFAARSTCYSLRYVAQNQVAFTCYGVQNPDACQLDLPGQGERLVPENQEIVINSQTQQVVSEGIEPDYETMVRYYQVARSTIGQDSAAAQCVQPFVDRDGDNVFNPDDVCPNDPGSAENAGCPDTDGDDTHDGIDDCPEIPGPASNNGCPIPDTDGDGFNDFIDECRTTPGTLNGCPDADDDGIRDSEDACPNEPGLVEYNGCNIPDSDSD